MKNKNYKRSYILGIILILISLYFGFNNTTYAAYFSSNIDEINEVNYSGYKTKLKELKKTYPNIELLYTGLNWETVIANEYGVHGRNLVLGSNEIEWICPICNESGKKYDGRWYCASEEAVRYMMDPRNFLNENDIFQFQNLKTSVGANEIEVERILKANEVTFLQNDIEAIKAFAKIAKKNDLNVYHLIMRVIQEQGRNGSSPLASGSKFVGLTGNVYEGYYNLFNINAYGSTSKMIIENGLKWAKEHNWTSKALSIEGGGNFVGKNYLDVGQNTLYLQKFAVYNTDNQLYWHQYMQNLLAAKNESKLLLDSYKITGIDKNKDFKFIIPMYENMPRYNEQIPTKKYEGTINTKLDNIEFLKINNSNFIKGTIDIAEWVKGECKIPKAKPVLRLISEQGSTEYEIFVKHLNGIKYYFDCNIDNIDTNQEYFLEAELIGRNNLAPIEKKIQIVNIENKILTENFKNKKMKFLSNKLIITNEKYKGDINTELTQINLIRTGNGNNYLIGKVDIAEWVNNICKRPKSLPEIYLKSTDGKVSMKTYINYQQEINYYFDLIINNLDYEKQYYLEARLITEENESNNKIQRIKLGNKKLGKFTKYKVSIENDIIKINYEGILKNNLKEISLIKNANNEDYLIGKILIEECIENECKKPNAMPSINFKSTDGSINKKAYIKYLNNSIYYFDININQISMDKAYVFEVNLTDKNNVADENKKKANIKFVDGEIGKNKNLTVTTLKNEISFKYTDGYKGYINTELSTIGIVQNAEGKNFLSGKIDIAEWVENNCNRPKNMPEIRLKSTDGKINKKTYINYQYGIKYYFDIMIEDLDKSKEYYLEVKLTGNKNIATEKEKTQRVRILKQGQIGIFKNSGNKVFVKNGIISIKK